MGPARWADFGGLPAHRLPQWRDCSSFASEMYAGAGLPDPSANGYRGGYTGTMTGHGRPVALATAPVGALVFYGGTWAVPEHVAIHAGHQLVYSHGSEGGPYFLSATYRGDLTQVRAYA
jgi:cell wall-associated NlpC family hydrolase